MSSVGVIERPSSTSASRAITGEQTAWQRWLDRPEKIWLRQLAFQMHFWIGAALGAYIFVMSLSGAVIVFRNDLPASAAMGWLVRLHSTFLAGTGGRMLHGVGALSLMVLSITGAVIWWPGRAHWRRSLTIEWGARFPRLNWDVHSAAGFWFLPFVAIWATSGLYLVQPQLFNALLYFDPADRIVDRGLFFVTALHFGRFNWLTEIVWSIAGLVPAVLGFTGVFICCRRVMFGKPSNPNHS